MKPLIDYKATKNHNPIQLANNRDKRLNSQKYHTSTNQAKINKHQTVWSDDKKLWEAIHIDKNCGLSNSFTTKERKKYTHRVLSHYEIELTKNNPIFRTEEECIKINNQMNTHYFKYHIIGDRANTENKACIIQNKFIKLGLNSKIFKINTDINIAPYLITIKDMEIPKSHQIHEQDIKDTFKKLKALNLFTEKEFNEFYMVPINHNKEIKINNQIKTNQMSKKDNLAYQPETDDMLQLMKKHSISHDLLRDFQMTDNREIIATITYWENKKQSTTAEARNACENAIIELEGLMLQRIAITKDISQMTAESSVGKTIESFSKKPETEEDVDISQRETTEKKVSNKLANDNKSPAKVEKNKPVTMKLNNYKKHVTAKFQQLKPLPKEDIRFKELEKEVLLNITHPEATPVTVNVIYNNNDPVNLNRKDAIIWLREITDTYTTEKQTDKKEETKKDTSNKEESTEIVTSFTETPTFQDLGTECKKLIKANKPEAALKLAKKYYGSGDYIPKKDNQKATEKNDTEVANWIKALTNSVNKNHDIKPVDEQKEDTKKGTEEKVESKDTTNWGTTCNTLEEENKALNEFISKIEGVMDGAFDEEGNLISEELHGTKSKEVEELYTEFFKNRDYQEKQIDKLREYMDSEETERDIFEILNGEINVTSKETITTLKEAIKDKAKANDFKTIIHFYTKELVGQIVEDESGEHHELYTPLHVLTLIETLYNSVRKEIETPKETDKEPKIKGIPRREVKEVVTNLVKMNGKKEDLLNNGAINKMVGKPIIAYKDKIRTYSKLEEMKEFLEELYDEAQEDFNNRTTYPLEDFLNTIRQDFKNGKTENECFENNLPLVYPDKKKFLNLFDDDSKTGITIHFDSTKDVKEYIVSIYETETEAADTKKAKETLSKEKQENQKEENESDNAKEWTEPTIVSFNEIRPLGESLIKEHNYTQEQINNWALKHILNKQLKEQAKDTIFTNVDQVKDLVKDMVKNFNEKQSKKQETEELTEIDKAIIEALKEENALIHKVARNIHDLFEEETTLGEMFERTKVLASKHAIPIWSAFLKKQAEKNETTGNPQNIHVDKKEETANNQVVVEENLSETDPNLWNEYKDSKELKDLHSIVTELCTKDEKDKALSLLLQVLSLGNIEAAKNWNKEQITKWFSTTFLQKKVEESETTNENSKEVEHNAEDLDLTELGKANNKKAFRSALEDIMKVNKDTDSLRVKLITFIKSTENEGKYLQAIHNNKKEDIQGMISRAKKQVSNIT